MSQPMRRLGLYRDTQNGWIAGVCAGLAARLRISPIWLRAGFVLAVVLLHESLIPALIYFVLAFLMPYADSQTAGVQTAWAGLKESVNFGPSPSASAQFSSVAARFAALETRIKRIEAAVTSADLKLHRAFKDLGA